MDQIKIIEETEKYFIGEIDNKKVKLFKINTDKLSIERNNELYKLAKFLSPFTILNLIMYCDNYLTNVPNVDEYEEVVNNLIEKLKNLESEILKLENVRNICFYYIKEMEPYHYGKAQTFTKNLKLLYMDLCNIAHFMKDCERWLDWDPIELNLKSYERIKEEYESS